MDKKYPKNPLDVALPLTPKELLALSHMCDESRCYKCLRPTPWMFQCIPANFKLPGLHTCAPGSFSKLESLSVHMQGVPLVPRINTPGNSPQPLLWKSVYKCTSFLTLGTSILKCVFDTAFHRTELWGSEDWGLSSESSTGLSSEE